MHRVFLTNRTEQGSQFYDHHLKKVEMNLEDSPWMDLYTIVLKMLPPPDPGIADIGCGTGRFAKLLQLNGYSAYWGVDFSPKRIALAKSYVRNFEFQLGNVFDDEIQSRFVEYKIFIMIDLLEHLQNDRGLIAALPSGSLLVIAMPNFDSASHVRFFEDYDAVISRYNGLIEFAEGERVTNIRKRNPVKRIYVMRGFRL